MTREELAGFHQTWFRPNNATLVIVGDTTLSEITPKLEKLLADWKPATVPKKSVKDVPLAAKSAVYLIDKPGAVQSVIIAGSLAPPTANPKEIAIQAMNDGLGGTFASRLNLNLREVKHWSYGVRSMLFDARGERPFFVLAPVQSDKTGEAMAEVAGELRGIVGEHPIAAGELKDIQANETLKLPGSRETMNAVGSSVLDLVQFGLPDDYYETYAAKVRALTTGDVEDAAKTVVRPDNLTWLIVGDRAKIEAEVKQSGLGELRFLSPEGKPL